jgi:sulfide dehydrogenase cytochrome subunit
MALTKRVCQYIAVATLALTTDAVAAELKGLVENCAKCHGENGVSTNPDIPTIAGFSPQYASHALKAYKDKSRPCPEAKVGPEVKVAPKTTMCAVVQDMSEADMADVAKFYAAKKFVRAKQKIQLSAELKAKAKALHTENCQQCHVDDGSVADDNAGFLAGQWQNYLAQTFADLTADKRSQPKAMKKAWRSLDKESQDILIKYYASFE